MATGRPVPYQHQLPGLSVRFEDVSLGDPFQFAHKGRVHPCRPLPVLEDKRTIGVELAVSGFMTDVQTIVFHRLIGKVECLAAVQHFEDRLFSKPLTQVSGGADDGADRTVLDLSRVPGQMPMVFGQRTAGFLSCFAGTELEAAGNVTHNLKVRENGLTANADTLFCQPEFPDITAMGNQESDPAESQCFKDAGQFISLVGDGGYGSPGDVQEEQPEKDHHSKEYTGQP